MNLFSLSHVLLPVLSLPSWPAILLDSSSCQSHLRELFNLTRDSSPKSVTASAKHHCWCQGSQGNRALTGLKRNQANTGEMIGSKPPAHTASINGKDPEILSCRPLGDTTLKGKMSVSPGRRVGYIL